MRLKLAFILLLALVAESAFARLQGHHRRHVHGKHLAIEDDNDNSGPGSSLDPRALIDVNGNTIGIGPLTATLDIIPGATLAPTNDNPHDGPHDVPHDGPFPHGGHHGGHSHGHHPHGGHPHGGYPHEHDNNPSPHPIKATAGWDQAPPDGQFTWDGFGERTQSQGDGVGYKGNVGDPWGSNIVLLGSETDAPNYKYVAQLHGPEDANAESWKVVFWNKIGPDGKMSGWYQHSALEFDMLPNEIKYVAFDEDSQGGFGAAPGDHLPTDQWGGWSSTWGEFDFGDVKNHAMSGWDVSCIQAQNAGQEVQGIRMCLSNGDKCSTITTGAKKVENTYPSDKAGIDGLGGVVGAGAVRIVVELDYDK